MEEPKATAKLVWLDRSSPYPQVMFTSYWGGAHCCTLTGFANAQSKDQWRVTKLGALDGDGLSIEDVLDKGTPVLVGYDNAFLYAFGSYAGSVAPMQVQEFRNGKLNDVTREARFAPLLRRQLASFEKDVDWSDPDFERNNYLAGWVGLKILLGEKDAAWAEMLKRYDRKSEMGLESCAVVMKDAACPDDKVIRKSYPDALRDLLTQAGYLPKPEGAAKAEAPAKAEEPERDERVWAYLPESQSVMFAVPETESITARLTCTARDKAEFEVEFAGEPRDGFTDKKPYTLKVDKAGSVLEIPGQLQKYVYGDEFLGWNFIANLSAGHSVVEFLKVGGSIKVGAEPEYSLPLAGADDPVSKWQFACKNR
jgi:serine protease Do